MVFAMVFETLGIGLIIPVITTLSDSDVLDSTGYIFRFSQFWGIDSHNDLIIILSIILIVTYLLKNSYLSYFSWYKIHYFSTLRMNISNRLFGIYLSKPYSFHLERNSGQLVQNISTEVTIFTGRFLHAIATILSESLVLLGIILLLLFIEPMGALIIISVFFIIGWTMLSLTSKYIRKWGEERQYHDGKCIQHLQQGLGGVKDALLLDRIEYFERKYEDHNAMRVYPDQKQSFLQEVPRFWFEMIIVLGITIMIILMSMQNRQFSDILSILGVFGVAAFRILPSINRILTSVQSFRYSLPVLDALYKEFGLGSLDDGCHSIVEGHPISKNKTFNQLISFDDVVYTYTGSKNSSIKGISLEIYKGECVGIIGSSGSGKSTLVDILLGLLYPDSGTVTVDSKNIQENMRSWQDQVGYVPQDIYLIDDSLRNNIAFGIPENEVDGDRVDSAIQAAHLTDFISHLPQGLDTFVGERGVRLSGGQRQRIGIARALYYNPTVLVLDEATSSLDVATEKQIMKTVYELQKDKTIVIVAHRLSTIEKCDKLYQLKDGIVIKSGTPGEILNN